MLSYCDKYVSVKIVCEMNAQQSSYLSRIGWPWDRDGISHPTKALSRPGPGPGLAWDRELPSHRDLVPSHPMKKNFLPSHAKKCFCFIISTPILEIFN